MLNHPLKNGAKAKEEQDNCDKSPLGIIPQQIRGDLSSFSQNVMYGENFDKCSGCSQIVVDTFRQEREEFLIKALNNADYLEDLTGITAMNEAINDDDVISIGDDFDWD